MSLTTNIAGFIFDKETAKSPWTDSTSAGVAVWSTATRINASMWADQPKD